MEKIILVGYGGHAKSVADCIERQGKYQIAGYTDHMKQDAPYEYLGTDDVLEALFSQGIRNVAICVGYLGGDNIRGGLYERVKQIGFSLPLIVDPSAVISPSATIAEGSFIGKNAVVNAVATIGKMVIINTNAVVEHDCTVGDFVHVAVGAVLCGATDTGAKCLIGANATILQKVKIGEAAIVGAGTVVARDVKEGEVVKYRFDNLADSSGGGYPTTSIK